ncbi:MAG: N-acetylmuramic acid 6-phosphate etherase [Burkholderiales bacterium]|nr:N-acetylmuramic acid 6-phosphate etherase [Burkholderiales bacterium]
MQQQEILQQLKSLSTETINPNSTNIDIVSTIDKLRIINNEDKKVAEAISLHLESIAQVVDIATIAIKNGGRLIYTGAGTSGRLGILDASECPPTYGVDFNTILGLIAGGREAVWKAVEGAEDSEELGAIDLQKISLTDKDVVLGIAASGRTPYVIGGLKYASSIGAKTASLACNLNSVIGTYADYKIEVSAGAEVVTGSTRMKAGTTQKLILNMISTAVMINLGKTYRNLMVDVATSNAKLHARAKKIVMEATDVDFETAEKYLLLANNHVKTAIVMILNNIAYDEAIKKLDCADGIIRKII